MCTVHAIVVFGKIVVPDYTPVKWVDGRVDDSTCYRLCLKSTPEGVLWQKRCDCLLYWVLCNICIDSKDKAFAQGQGMDWIPDNCGPCKVVRRIFEQIVTYEEWQEPSCMQMMSRKPCGLGLHFPLVSIIINSDFLFFHRPCRWPFTRVALKEWVRMCNSYVISIIIIVWCLSHPVTLALGPSRPCPRPRWMLLCLSSLGWLFN